MDLFVKQRLAATDQAPIFGLSNLVMAEYPVALYAFFASVFLAGGGLLTLFSRRLPDRAFTLLAIATSLVAAGYVRACIGWDESRARIAELAAQSRVMTALFILFCGLLPWTIARGFRIPGRILPSFASLAAAGLLAANAAAPFSLRYDSIDPAESFSRFERLREFTPSSWSFTVASLAAAAFAFAIYASHRLWRRGESGDAILLALAAAILLSGVGGDLALESAPGPSLRGEWVGVASMASLILAQRARSGFARSNAKAIPTTTAES